MKAHIYILTTACTILSSCVKEKNAVTYCHYDNPLVQIEWLRTIKNNMELSGMTNRFEIYSYSYLGNDVFLVDECKNCPDYQSFIYDCNENVICTVGGLAPNKSCKNLLLLGTNKKLLYSK